MYEGGVLAQHGQRACQSPNRTLGSLDFCIHYRDITDQRPVTSKGEHTLAATVARLVAWAAAGMAEAYLM